jgi:hypothetical protein
LTTPFRVTAVPDGAKRRAAAPRTIGCRSQQRRHCLSTLSEEAATAAVQVWSQDVQGVSQMGDSGLRMRERYGVALTSAFQPLAQRGELGFLGHAAPSLTRCLATL